MGEQTIQLDAGRLVFQIQVDGEAKSWAIDLIEAKLVCEQVESRHKLRQESGRLLGTTAFFRDLAEAFCCELGCPVQSSTVASRVWGIVNERFIQVSENLARQLAEADGRG